MKRILWERQNPKVDFWFWSGGGKRINATRRKLYHNTQIHLMAPSCASPLLCSLWVDIESWEKGLWLELHLSPILILDLAFTMSVIVGVLFVGFHLNGTERNETS